MGELRAIFFLYHVLFFVFFLQNNNNKKSLKLTDENENWKCSVD